MDYIKLCTIGFLTSIIFNSCTNNQLDNHLNEISKSNSQINLRDWIIDTRHEDKFAEDYSLFEEINDTFYLLEFTYFKPEDSYACSDLIKSYVKEEVYHELVLINNDTLYHYTYNRNENLIRDYISVEIEDMNFISGWYYYQYKYSMINMKQKEFFMENRDSLIRVKGDNLPELPELLPQ